MCANHVAVPTGDGSAEHVKCRGRGQERRVVLVAKKQFVDPANCWNVPRPREAYPNGCLYLCRESGDGDLAPPPPLCLGTALRKNRPPPGSTVEFSHSFFLLQNCIFRGSGGCRTAIQVCRTTFHVYCMVCGIWKVIFSFVSPLGSLRRNQPLVPRSNIAGFSTRGGGGAFSAIKARSQRPSTCKRDM